MNSHFYFIYIKKKTQLDSDSKVKQNYIFFLLEKKTRFAPYSFDLADCSAFLYLLMHEPLPLRDIDTASGAQSWLV